MSAYRIIAIAAGWLATGTLLGAPLAAALVAIYRDITTWPEQVMLARIERARRLGYALPRRTFAERLVADLAAVDARHTPLDTAGLPPAAPVERDPLTQPEMARAVSLRHPDRPVTLPARRPLLARLGHWRTAC